MLWDLGCQGLGAFNPGFRKSSESLDPGSSLSFLEHLPDSQEGTLPSPTPLGGFRLARSGSQLLHLCKAFVGEIQPLKGTSTEPNRQTKNQLLCILLFNSTVMHKETPRQNTGTDASASLTGPPTLDQKHQRLLIQSLEAEVEV